MGTGTDGAPLRRIVLLAAVVAVGGLTLWHVLPGDPNAGTALTSAQGGAATGPALPPAVVPGVAVASSAAASSAAAGAGPGVASVAGGAARVVPVAVTAQEQAAARDHWSPTAMETATAGDVDLAPQPTRPAGASSAPVAPAAPSSVAVASVAPASAPPSAAAAGPSSPASTSSPPVSQPAASTAAATSPSSPPSSTAPSSAPVSPTATTDPDQSAGAPWTEGGLVARTTGKVFFTVDGKDYTCSASAVASRDNSIVLTAAHCVVGVTGQATKWVFVPGYRQGQAPYGVFAATHFAVPARYSRANPSVDYAFVNVGPNAAGQSLGAAVGGQPVAFVAETVDRAAAFGYPQVAPFDGSRVTYCRGALGRDTQGTGDLAMTCGMTSGSSGGPWLTGLDSRTGVGRVVSVTSFSYADQPGVLYGPLLGSTARQLFDAVADDPAA